METRRNFRLIPVILWLLTSGTAEAQVLSKEYVGSIWPYPEKVLKVVSAAGEINTAGKTLKMVDVITKSPTTKKCQAYQTYFRRTSDGWEFDSVVNEFPASCKKLVAKEGAQTGSATGRQTSADPREHTEKGLQEVDRTINDVESVDRTIKRVKNIKSLF